MSPKMHDPIEMIFLRHPAEEGLTYKEHLLRSMWIAATFGCATVKAMIHAVVPLFFQTSSTDTVRQLHRQLFPDIPAPPTLGKKKD